MIKTNLKDLHEFWFQGYDGWLAEDQGKRWFAGGKDMDRQVKERFTDLATSASAGKLDDQKQDDRLVAALVVALDQLPRNIHRGTAVAFAADAQAMTLTQELLTSGRFQGLWPAEKLFVLMPFQHVEDLSLQEESIRLFKELAQSTPENHRKFIEGTVEYAILHRDIIARFGRFPHRNKALGREPTPEETAWLADGGHSFGQ